MMKLSAIIAVTVLCVDTQILGKPDWNNPGVTSVLVYGGTEGTCVMNRARRLALQLISIPPA